MSGIDKSKRLRITVEGEAGTGRVLMAIALKKFLQSRGVYAIVESSPEVSQKDLNFNTENFKEKNLELVHGERFVDIEIKQTKRNLNSWVETHRDDEDDCDEEDGCCCGQQWNPSHCCCGSIPKRPEPIVYAKRRAHGNKTSVFVDAGRGDIFGNHVDPRTQIKITFPNTPFYFTTTRGELRWTHQYNPHYPCGVNILQTQHLHKVFYK